MKNRGAILILLGFLISLTLVSCKSLTKDDQNRISMLEERIASLEEERDRALEERDLALGELEILRLEEDKDLELLVSVIDKINMEKDPDSWIFSSQVSFPLTIKNNGKREIDRIEGELVLRDKLGDTIIEIPGGFEDLDLGAGELISLDGPVLEINEYLDGHKRVYELDFKDLLIDYEVKNIVYK